MLPLLLKSGQFCFLRHAAALGLTLALGSLPGALQAQTQTDDFNDGDDSFPLQWTEYDPISATPYGVQASWSYPVVGDGFGYTITATNSPDPGTVGPGRAASLLTNVVYTTFYVSVDILGWDTNKDSAFGILARVETPGLGETTGYSFTYQSDDHDVQISRITAEAPSAVSGTVKSITLDSTKHYRFIFQGNGTYLEARIYDFADLSTPLLVVQGTDATYASGISGLVVYDNGSGGGTTGADATFDNFLASGAPQLVACENPVVVSDDFGDGNDNGWTHYLTTSSNTPAMNQTWTVTNSAYRLTSAAGGDLNHIGRVASFRVDGPELSDFVASVDLIDWDNGQSQNMGLVARVQTPIATADSPSIADFPAGYLLVYVNRSSAGAGGTDQLRIYKLGPSQADFLNGASGTIGGLGQFCCGAPTVPNASASPNPTNNYRLIFKGVGNTLTGQIIDLNTGLPLTFNNGAGGLTNTVWANDYKTSPNPLYTKGHFGLMTFQGQTGAPDATFDNFCVTAAAPSVAITFDAGLGEISWPANQEGIWALESSPDLPGATWTEVPFSALTFAAGNLKYSVPADGNSFFRLRKI